jgi:subtilisin family serine protease
VVGAFDAFNSNSDPSSLNSHGTHVSSILGAAGGNSYGITGVVPGAVKIVDGRFLNAQNQGDSDTALRVVRWMEQDMQARREQDPNVKFIGSNSWGGDVKSSFLEEAMQRLAAYDYLPITSAGNHGGNNDTKGYYPCTFNLNANTCVAASDRVDLRASFSAYGPKTVHVFAPGFQIYGIIPGTMSGSTYTSKYEVKQGTSQAVPHVSGVAALIWAANPNLSANDVRQVLLKSVDRLPGAEAEVLSGGRVNAYRAVLMATGQEPSKADRKLAATSEGGGGCSLKVSDRPLMGLSMSAILLAALVAGLFSFYRRSSIRSSMSPSRSARSANRLR